jgi:EAL domain-containing protein (putative c-di-GMP-specific phosphodiesterase class I)
VISLAESLGMTVIAEGVETEQQLHQLRELECPYAQGFLFARPAPASEIKLGESFEGLARGVGDPFVIREFMRQIGIPARIDR